MSPYLRVRILEFDLFSKYIRRIYRLSSDLPVPQ